MVKGKLISCRYIHFDEIFYNSLFAIISIKRTWSQVGRSINDGWPESTNDSENKDWSVAQQTTPSSAYSDLVQEFEPGKPWKVILFLTYFLC